MTLQTILLHSTSDIFDSLADNPVTKYDDELESASDDQLTAWLHENGVSEEELAVHELEGNSLRDTCADLIRSGCVFRAD